MCNESNDFKRVVQCINNRTYTHNDIVEKYTKVNIVNNTGFLISCSFTEYKTAAEHMKYEYGTQKLSVLFLSPDVLKRTDQLLYQLESFVSEFGGALGLFLGFSCMMIWHGLEILFLHGLKNSQSIETWII